MDAHRLTNGLRARGNLPQRGAPTVVADLLAQSKVMDKRHSALISMANEFASNQASLAEVPRRPRSTQFRSNPAVESDALVADNKTMTMEHPKILRETNGTTRNVETVKSVVKARDAPRMKALESDGVLAERIHATITRPRRVARVKDGSKKVIVRQSHNSTISQKNPTQRPDCITAFQKVCAQRSNCTILSQTMSARLNCATPFHAYMRETASHHAPGAEKPHGAHGDRAPFVTAFRSSTLASPMAKTRMRPNPKAKATAPLKNNDVKGNETIFNPPQRPHLSRDFAHAARYGTGCTERSSSEESLSRHDSTNPTCIATKLTNTTAQQDARSTTFRLRWEGWETRCEDCDGNDDDATDNSSGSNSNTPLPDKAMAGMLQLQELWPGFTFERTRVRNEKLVRMYEAQREIHQFSDADERLLWHGTNFVSAQEIVANGFNRSHCGAAHGSKYGCGTYFTTNLRYAARFCGDDQTKAMFLCRVSVGTWVKGQRGLVEPPRKENAENAGERYDSTVNDVDNPTIWCVFRDFQAVPVYLFVGKG